MPYAKTNAGELYYDVVDSVAPWHPNPETIVFHHGIGADPGIWKKWYPALIDRYRLVAFDMRGYGHSNIPDDNFRWTLDRFADDLFAVADAAGADRFHLVGESLGGTIALLCAKDQPSKVVSITVSNGAHAGGSIQHTNAWEKNNK